MFIVFTADQRATAIQGGPGWGDGEVAADPRPVDGVSPGRGVNLNPEAVGFVSGAAVDLEGRFVASQRMIDDPQYGRHAPDLVALLKTLPWCALEVEGIFAAPPEA